MDVKVKKFVMINRVYPDVLKLLFNSSSFDVIIPTIKVSPDLKAFTEMCRHFIHFHECRSDGFYLQKSN